MGAVNLGDVRRVTPISPTPTKVALQVPRLSRCDDVARARTRLGYFRRDNTLLFALERYSS